MKDPLGLSDERSTPSELFDPLHKEFHFTLDVCAMAENAKLHNYFSLTENGLKQPWAGHRCFMNPPYSDIRSWLYKAREESLKGALVVAILPCDTSTKWFHEYFWNKDLHDVRGKVRIRFPSKRFKFGDNTNSAKFATLIGIFKPHSQTY